MLIKQGSFNPEIVRSNFFYGKNIRDLSYLIGGNTNLYENYFKEAIPIQAIVGYGFYYCIILP
jgi:hypothetical protein